ncbi:MAG: DNA mismatch repair protein MutS [Sphaerochaetaceae bacterium]
MEDKNLTPMMVQYLEIKKEHKEEVLFFRLGDFYEMFLDDAVEVSKLLNITLTKRNGIAMCGIPYHAAKNYIKRLLDYGKKVAICEQISLPTEKGAIAKREVVQIITPATAIEDEYIDSVSNNYILSISLEKESISCAYSELSYPTIYTIALPLEKRFEQLRSLIERIGPKEILIDEENYFSNSEFATLIDQSSVMVSRLPAWYFLVSEAHKLLTEHFETQSLKQFGYGDSDLVLKAAGSLFRYIKESSKTSLNHINHLQKINQQQTMLIDEASRKNLELLSNLQDGSTKFTLFSSLNKSVTSGGARLLKEWVSNPITDLEQIKERQKWVKWFLDDKEEHQRVRTCLVPLRDLSRLATRVAMMRANPSDLVAIREAIATFFELTEVHQSWYHQLLIGHLDDQQMSSLVNLMEVLIKAIKSDTMGPFKVNEVIRSGYDDTLDELRKLTLGGSEKLNQYVSTLKEETKIPVIKLGNNKIIGHYLEIPKTHSSLVPESFFRKQTLVAAERYTTDQLVELENEILSSSEKMEKLEKELFNSLIVLTNKHTQSLLSLGRYFSTIDVLQSFAFVARENDYCEVEFVEKDIIDIQQGRHPVVEQNLRLGEFVSNDCNMKEDEMRFCLITAPNMAGKSTYLRQNALIVLMAHIGSYVPAKTARLGLTDRLFCRVGASDNLARGESTFLIEMQETAHILQTATKRSLAIIDEIGRGTSTQDGLSIAYAVMRALVAMGVKTLFATHYHELTMLDTSHMQLLTLSVAETKKSVLFLRKIEKGVAKSSYGLHVAKMAGVPSSVIKEAATFQKDHYADYALNTTSQQLDLFTQNVVLESNDDNFFLAEVEDLIRSFDIDKSTPLEALQLLEKLQKMVE